MLTEVKCPICGTTSAAIAGAASRAVNCPNCGELLKVPAASIVAPGRGPHGPARFRPSSLIWLGIAIMLFSSFVIGGIWSLSFFGSAMQEIHRQVVADALEEYAIIKTTGGSAIDAYVRASLVAEAYLQAKDEENYRKWKEIANREAAAAALPVP